jgi:hypothetical protein
MKYSDPCTHFWGAPYDGCGSILVNALETPMHIKPKMPFECTHLRFSSPTAPCMVKAAIEEQTPVDRKQIFKIPAML